MTTLTQPKKRSAKNSKPAPITQTVLPIEVDADEIEDSTDNETTDAVERFEAILKETTYVGPPGLEPPPDRSVPLPHVRG